MAVLEIHDRLLDLSEAIRPLSATVIELAEAVIDDDVQISKIAQIVSGDPGLAAPLLREANSAFSGSSSEVDTVEGAVVRLGIARVLAVATSASLDGVVPVELPGYDIAGDDLWIHAKTASLAADSIRRLSPMEIGPEIVTAALLHDIGKVIMGQVLVYRQLDQARIHTGDITVAERELISLDHAEVGALLLEMWRLPKSISDPVRHHHAPFELDGLGAHAIHIADIAAWGVTNPDEYLITPVAEDSLQRLGLTLDQIVDAVRRQLERADED